MSRPRYSTYHPTSRTSTMDADPYGHDFPMHYADDLSSPDSFSSSGHSGSPPIYHYSSSSGNPEEGYGIGFGAPVDFTSHSSSTSAAGSGRGRRGGRGHSVSPGSSRGSSSVNHPISPTGLYHNPTLISTGSTTSGVSIGTNPNRHLVDEPEYPPTSLPPQSYGDGPSPFSVPQHFPKIYGSQMDRLPDIENRMSDIERRMRDILRQRGQDTLNSVTLTEEVEAELRRQEEEEDELVRIAHLRLEGRGGSHVNPPGRGTGKRY